MHRMLPLLLIVAAACTAEDRRSPLPAVAPPVSLGKATQADLARELDEADLDGTWYELKRRWQGQRLRWTVTRHRLLCRTADACNVAVFPIERPAKHGWMPTLELSAEQFAALERTCGSVDACEVTIEGTLSRFEVSGEFATSLRFTDVKLAGDVTARR